MLCLDTYALVEIAKNNPVFTRLSAEEFIVSDITLAEFYHVILRSYDEKTAEYWFRKISPFSQAVSKELLKDAVKFRHSNRQKNFSFIDSVGYVFAMSKKLKFVTGDMEFEGMPGVEFLRKE